jgi:hypothetical protein
MKDEFNEMINNFKNQIKCFNEKHKLDVGNIFIEITENESVGGMRETPNGKRIPNIGFIPELEFILAVDC